MSLTPYEEIKKQVEEGYEELSESRYPEDLLNEWAESEVPVYTNHIIQEWTDLSPEDSDRWQETGLDLAKENSTISDLMWIDLRLYYDRLFGQAWREVQEEKESAE